MSQKLDAKAMAKAFTIITVLTYVICAVVLWISISFATTLGNYFLHGIELTGLVVVRGIGFTIISLILAAVFAGIFGWLFAYIYNKLSN